MFFENEFYHYSTFEKTIFEAFLNNFIINNTEKEVKVILDDFAY